jgi:hypothetical protein
MSGEFMKALEEALKQLEKEEESTIKKTEANQEGLNLDNDGLKVPERSRSS